MIILEQALIIAASSQHRTRKSFQLSCRQKSIFLGLEDGKTRFIREVTLLSQTFALSIPHEEALAVKDEVAFFQAVKARLVKFVGDRHRKIGYGH